MCIMVGWSCGDAGECICRQQSGAGVSETSSRPAAPALLECCAAAAADVAGGDTKCLLEPHWSCCGCTETRTASQRGGSMLQISSRRNCPVVAVTYVPAAFQLFSGYSPEQRGNLRRVKGTVPVRRGVGMLASLKRVFSQTAGVVTSFVLVPWCVQCCCLRAGAWAESSPA